MTKSFCYGNLIFVPFVARHWAIELFFLVQEPRCDLLFLPRGHDLQGIVGAVQNQP